LNLNPSRGFYIFVVKTKAMRFSRCLLLFSLTVTSSFTLSSALAQTSVPGNLGFEYQRLNNCGPMSAKMTLSLYGFTLRQADVAAALKGTPTDRNVTTPEMAAYLERFGLKTVRRWLITPALTRRLVAAGFPVILHQTQTSKDDIGHFRVAHAFDKTNVYSGDSMFGPRTRHPDADFARLSQPYNGEYLLAYKPDQARTLERVLGADWDRNANLARLETVSKARIKVAPRDAFAWWGLGQSRLYRGSSRTAAPAFREAARLRLPKKHYWYQQDALDAWNRVGWYELTRTQVSKALGAYPSSAELNLHLARALEGLKRKTQAITAWRAVLVENPSNIEARAALKRGS
jgi:Peptidase_C39 like family